MNCLGDRIEIYTDGCWLYENESRPVSAGGWGAVFLEVKDGVPYKEQHFSGTSPKNLDLSRNAENIAIISALVELKLLQAHRTDGFAPTIIVLHTDQHELPLRIIDVQQGAHEPNPLVRQIARMAKEMQVHMEYTPSSHRDHHNPTHAQMMGTADHLAANAAHGALSTKERIYRSEHGWDGNEKDNPRLADRVHAPSQGITRG